MRFEVQNFQLSKNYLTLFLVYRITSHFKIVFCRKFSTEKKCFSFENSVQKYCEQV